MWQQTLGHDWQNSHLMPDTVRHTGKTIFKKQNLETSVVRGKRQEPMEQDASHWALCVADLVLGKTAIPGVLEWLKRRGCSFSDSTMRAEESSWGMLAGRWLDFAVREVCGNRLACKIRPGCCWKPHDLNESVPPCMGQVSLHAHTDLLVLPERREGMQT